VGEALALVHQVLDSPGRPLDAATRAYFEPRFKCDFSAVRVHADAEATESARQVNSLAYTVGTKVVFRSDTYAPDTPVGKRLLAHELVHVVQQRHATANGPLSLGRPGDLAEQEAQRAANDVLSGRQAAFSLPEVTAGQVLVRRAPPGGQPPSVVSLSENQARLAELMDRWVPDAAKQQLTTISRAAAIESSTGRQVYLIAIAGEGAALPVPPSLLRPDEILVPYVGGHAELQTMHFAESGGYKILPGALEPSRAFCTNCAWWARKKQLAPPSARVNVGGRVKPLAEVSNQELLKNLEKHQMPGARGELTAKGAAKRAAKSAGGAAEIPATQSGTTAPRLEAQQGGAPKTELFKPSGGGSPPRSGGASGAAFGTEGLATSESKALTANVKAVAIAETKLGPTLMKTLASKVGSWAKTGVTSLLGTLSIVDPLLLPGPWDAIKLMVNVAEGYTAAWDSIRSRNTQSGFTGGLAASLLRLSPEEVRKTLERHSPSTDVHTDFAASAGMAESAFNRALGDGYRYGNALPREARNALRELSGLAAGDKSPNTIWAMGKALLPTVDQIFEEARKRAEAARLEKQAQELQRRFDAGHTTPR
jgi:hypothetical protein